MNETLQAIIGELAVSWNAGDGQRFASVFAEDAVQINIFGSQLCGRGEIAERHDHIFKTIFRGSTNSLTLIDARELSADVLVARISSVVRAAPAVRGELQTVGSLVLQRSQTGRWEIVLFHNTRVASDE